jgi:hypothetical protein
MKTIKHEHGTPNPIIETEERSMLAVVDRALASSGNPQTIGKNGEVPLQSFLTRHLPNTLAARTGHFVTPLGQLSPQIDILVVDSRYPLLAENNDDSVLVMLHSVVCCIEVKTNIRTTDLPKIRNNSKKILDLSKEVASTTGRFSDVSCLCFAYRSDTRLDTLADRFFEVFVDDSTHTDLYLLRVPEPDRVAKGEHGALLHLEPSTSGDAPEVDEWIPTLIPEHTPLSDFYYSLIQNSYYCLEDRKYGFGDIGAHIMEYMSWSTVISK